MQEEEEIAGIRVQCATPRSQIDAGAILYFLSEGYVEGGPTEDLVITARLAKLTGRKISVPHYRELDGALPSDR